jgi:hypothetical protein
MTSGLVCSITMTCGGGGGAEASTITVGGGAVSVFTVTCSFDFKLPDFCAATRRRWTESITSSGCARNASPRSFTQSGFSPIMMMTCGNATSDCTLGSHGSFATILTASSPFCSECARDHFVAPANAGYVAAISTCESSGSG